jgi:hypothetical protein
MLVAFALVALFVRSGPQVDRSSGWGSGTPHAVSTVIAALCLLAAGLIVCYGL